MPSLSRRRCLIGWDWYPPPMPVQHENAVDPPYDVVQTYFVKIREVNHQR